MAGSALVIHKEILIFGLLPTMCIWSNTDKGVIICMEKVLN